MGKKLSNRIKTSISNITSLDKEINGLTEQINKYRQSYKEIKSLIKYYKKNRNKYMQAIVGGNLIRPMNNKDTIDTLEKRMKQVKIAIDSVEEQITHREDSVMEEYLKLYDMLESKIPNEYLENDED